MLVLAVPLGCERIDYSMQLVIVVIPKDMYTCHRGFKLQTPWLIIFINGQEITFDSSCHPQCINSFLEIFNL